MEEQIRFYAHYEENEPNHTSLILLNQKNWNWTLLDVTKKFVEDYNSHYPKYQKEFNNNEVKISKASGRKLNIKQTARRVVLPKEDLIISVLKPKKKEIKKQEIKKPEIKKKVIPQKKITTKTKPQPKKRENKSLLLKEAEKSFKEQKYAYTMKIYKKILEYDPNNYKCLIGKSRIYSAIRKWKKTISVLNRLLEMNKYSKDTELLYRLGEAYFHDQRYLECIRLFQTLVSALEENKLQAKNKMQMINDSTIYLARSLKLGKIPDSKETAFTLCRAVFTRNNNHLQGCLELGRILIEKKMYSEATNLFLRCIVLYRDNKDVKKTISTVMRSLGKKSVQLVKNELKTMEDLSSTLAYVGFIIKEFGATKESELFYHEALTSRPNSASHFLNYIHLLQINNKYEEALNVCLSFIKSNPLLMVGTLKLQTIYGCIKELEQRNKTNRKSQFQQLTEEQKKQFDEKMKQFDEYEIKREKLPKTKCNYTPNTLDLLAAIFTLTKILFVKGYIRFIPDICNLVNTFRANQELHLTSIRNEAAYFTCISQLMSSLSSQNFESKPIYVLGDSHCLSTGWRNIEVNSEKCVLIPKLVTGLKIWHLRDESSFYPKINFWNIANTVPKNSNVIMIFGEIDCREGILLAMNKYIYKSLEEGILVAIDIYEKNLIKLLKTKNWNIYIHPIIPVLNETRNTVKMFNVLLKERILKMKKKYSNIHWMDFFEDLLEKTGNFLNPNYKFDGTHLHPSYVSLIEKSINGTKLK
ncbi:hypothetical protein M0812_22173 [Anaeramoeba flamelloides]|uniref:Uncharacterized protein n=1 Tax=Anaeramoeba flamelloides TaxID=1746091 RepID=A0AAV7YWI2_9EUKA|nr:hypothetical protein M0812_22173 [Anaeramoeba flamelloides]